MTDVRTALMAQIACADAVDSNFISLTKGEGKRILKLLNEQESIIESLKSDLHETLEVVSGRLNVVRCRECNKSCLEEGKINGFWCRKRKEWHDGDWYCADGQRET